MTQQQMLTIKWQLQPLQVGLESLQRSWRVISYSTYFCLLINQRQLTCCRWLECPVIIPPTPSVLILLGLWQFWLHSVPMPFVTTPSSMMSSWGTHYYLITPHFSKQAAVSQMVITSLEDEPSVKIFLSGEVLFRGNVYPEGSFLELHMGALQCLPPEWLQSFWFRVKLPKSCCGWCYLLQTHTRGLFVWICSTETSGELEIWLFHPSLSKHRNKFQFPVGNDCSELGSTHHHHQQQERERERVCLLLVELCYSSFDLTQSISAVRVLVSSFTLDIKTVSLHTNTAAFCWSLSDCACIWLERENGSVN